MANRKQVTGADFALTVNAVNVALAQRPPLANRPALLSTNADTGGVGHKRAQAPTAGRERRVVVRPLQHNLCKTMWRGKGLLYFLSANNGVTRIDADPRHQKGAENHE